MTTQIARDPFARTSLMRRRAATGSCAWCGHIGRRWQYAWEGDQRPLHPYDWPFRAWCSVSCYRAYTS